MKTATVTFLTGSFDWDDVVVHLLAPQIIDAQGAADFVGVELLARMAIPS